jgi:hypothetical protein
MARWNGLGDAPTLMMRVDRALYAAKHSGRNRIVADRPDDAGAERRGAAPVPPLGDAVPAPQVGDAGPAQPLELFFDAFNGLSAFCTCSGSSVEW